MTSRTTLAAITVAATALIGTACEIDIDLGESVTQQYDVADFDSVTIDAPFDVTIRTGVRHDVEIEAPEGVLDDLVVEVTDGDLLIDIDRSAFRFGGGDLVASIVVTDLTAIDASSASDIVIPDLDVDTLELDASGASSISLSGEIDDLTLSLSGASDADLLGTSIERATIDLSGASSADFGQDVTLVEGDLSGASSIDVDRSTNLRVDTSGASNIDRNG